MTFLAQAPASDPTSAASLGWLLLAVAAGAGALNQVMKLLDRNKPSPPLHQEYATKAEVKAIEDRCTAQIEEIRSEIREAGQRNEDRVIRLHDRLDQQTERIISIVQAK